MSLQTRSQQSFTFDALTELEDGAAPITATGAGSAVLDFGNITSGPAVEQIAYTPGWLVVDVSAFDFGTGDEVAQIIYQLSDDTSGNGVGFDGGDTVVNKAVLPMGAAGGIPNSTADDESAVGRNVIEVDNEHKGTVYRFARVFVVMAGTTPSITFVANLSRQGGALS